MEVLTQDQKDHLDTVISKGNLNAATLFSDIKGTPGTPDTFTPPGPKGHIAAYIDYIYKQDLSADQREKMSIIIQSTLSDSKL